MAVTTSLCNSFVDELLEGRHQIRDSGGNTLKTALIKSSEAGTYGSASTNYSDITGNTDEPGNSGTYSAGGSATTVQTGYPKLETGSTFVVDFVDVSWTSATLSASGCMLYNTDATLGTGNRAISVYSFGGTVASTSGTFTIQWAAPGASAGPIYIVRA